MCFVAIALVMEMELHCMIPWSSPCCICVNQVCYRPPGTDLELNELEKLVFVIILQVLKTSDSLSLELLGAGVGLFQLV